MPTATTPKLVQMLLRSHVLPAEQCDELLRLETRFRDSRELALELVRREWLTPYQAAQIARGKAAELVVGPYVLLDRVGEGGMGYVYKARHRGLRRLCALKVIRRDCLKNPRAVRRFLREMRASARLRHPNIVHAFDADQDGDAHYIAMEFIDGVDLHRLVQESGPLDVLRACDYVRQAALGLQHAFEQGLVHRDIKPANLLVQTATGAVKVLDLGLARWVDPDAERSLANLTQQGIVMGTPEFIAPEQGRDSHGCDIRADLYSLGCTFYFLLTGQPPFPRESLTEKLLAHQLDEPEPAGPVRRARLLAADPNTPAERLDVPEAVEDVIKLLMQKDAGDRFQTPAHLAEVLAEVQRFLGSEPTTLSDAAAETISLETAFTFPPAVPTADSVPAPTASGPSAWWVVLPLAGLALAVGATLVTLVVAAWAWGLLG